MSFDALRQNITHEKEIIREMYVFTNQLNMIENLEKNRTVVINTEEKKLLSDSIYALGNQVKILNNSIPELIKNIGFFKRLEKEERPEIVHRKKNLVVMKYKPTADSNKIAITINEKDRKIFLKNLSVSNLSINKLKKKYAVERPSTFEFGRANKYAKLANKYFRNISDKLFMKGYLNPLNRDLRKTNSPYIVRTYASMILLSMSITLIISFFLVIFLIFFKVGLNFPFVSSFEGSVLLRIAKIFWLIFALPLLTGFLMYFYPMSQRKSIGGKIDQELPFITIHISAIATSGVEPLSIFNIVSKSTEYKYTRPEIIKLLNLVNFHGYDLVTSLKKISKLTPSAKLAALFDGLATAISTGGDLKQFLEKRAETLLFDYKLERERYTKTSETFLDIYISVAIAAPMIMMILFVILATTGASVANLSLNALTFLMLLGVVVLNIGFLVFLKLKQPAF